MVVLGAGLPLDDAANKFEDLSGVEIKPGDNPYDALINACHGSPVSSVFLSLLEKRRCWIEWMERDSFSSNGKSGA